MGYKKHIMKNKKIMLSPGMLLIKMCFSKSTAGKRVYKVKLSGTAECVTNIHKNDLVVSKKDNESCLISLDDFDFTDIFLDDKLYHLVFEDDFVKWRQDK